ncbi:coiled-coil domain-containing protein [Oopsacas minuta]|uniref:Coiled-coil domain-containing protein n=1 Tax=Oopsacas minuta TaxID=111878 RepID=A0AAV7K958_9METZ|nr:coiled-coil domain-containing protein [Oopsacas minuta]
MASLDNNTNSSDIHLFNEKRTQLSNQFISQHKDIWSVFRMRSDISESRNICLQLHSYNTTLDNAYNREARHFKANIDKLNSRVNLLQHKVRNIQSTGEYVSRIKALMQEIESCIETLRNSQRVDFDELQHEEHKLWQEIISHERRFDVWEKKKFNLQTQNKGLRIPLEKDDCEDDSTHIDVKNFREYLTQHCGHTGGWDEVDHATFIKLRLKHKNAPNLSEALLPFIPVHSVEEIRQHEQWFVQYTELCNKNREAIKSWREQHSKLRAEQKSTAAEIYVQEREREKEVLSRRDMLRKEERESKQAQLTEWRLQKEREIARMRAEQRNVEEKRISEMEMERAWKDVVRLQVADYISKRKDTEKQLEEIKLAELYEQRKREKLANIGVTKFLIRDKAAAELQRQKSDNLIKQELQRQEKLEKLRNKVRIEGMYQCVNLHTFHIHSD